MDKIDLDLIEIARKAVPYGNSTWQETSYTAGNEVPKAKLARLKIVMINFDATIDAMEMNALRLKKSDIQIEQLEDEISKLDVKDFTRRLKEVEVEELLFDKKTVKKLFDDANTKASTLYREAVNTVESFKTEHGRPPTREDFEKEQREYYTLRCLSSIKYNLLAGIPPNPGDMLTLEQSGLKAAIALKWKWNADNTDLIPQPLLEATLTNLELPYDTFKELEYKKVGE